MLPAVVVDGVLAEEIEGALAWASRHRLVLDWNAATRTLRAALEQRDTLERFYLQGQFNDYKALPPTWVWCDRAWCNAGAPHLSPKPGRSPFGSSMFIKNNNTAIICAPFNRLAFGVHGGPHSDWGDPVQWMNAGGRHIRATTIGDMLQSIQRDFRHTGGRMG